MTAELATALLLAGLAGFGIPLGGLLARVEGLAPDWLERELRHSVLAFGAGTLVAAVALVLVPEGNARVSTPVALVALLAGAWSFMLVDRRLAARGGPMAMLLAMLLDFVPEAMAMGALLPEGGGTGMLLALLIFVQNVPEGFNAWREAAARGLGPGRTLTLFVGLALLGPFATLAGATLLAAPAWLGGLMLFAAGGILYLMFQDIAPQVPLARHWAPPLAAVFGFALGLGGERLVAG